MTLFSMLNICGVNHSSNTQNIAFLRCIYIQTFVYCFENTSTCKYTWQGAVKERRRDSGMFSLKSFLWEISWEAGDLLYLFKGFWWDKLHVYWNLTCMSYRLCNTSSVRVDAPYKVKYNVVTCGISTAHGNLCTSRDTPNTFLPLGILLIKIYA